MYPPCVIPRYQRRSTFPLFGAAVITPFCRQTSSMPSLTETPRPTPTPTVDKQIPTAVSAGVQPNIIGQRKSKKEITSQLLREMTSRYALTPLKLIANELLMLHYDVYPTEICPNLNRSPSFIGIKNKDDGLLSGRCSPKLDIPRRRYCGLMIHQHPLARYSYKMNDRHLAHLIKKQVSSSSSSSSDYYYDNDDEKDEQQKKPVVTTPVRSAGQSIQAEKDTTMTKEQENIKQVPKENSYLELFAKKVANKKIPRRPLPFTKPSGYLEIYKKKVGFSKKKILPPIGTKPAEDKQPTLVLMPTPPSTSPPTSGQAAAMRSARKVRMENQQQKNKIPGIGKVDYI